MNQPRMNVESFNLDHRTVVAPYVRLADTKVLPAGDVIQQVRRPLHAAERRAPRDADRALARAPVRRALPQPLRPGHRLLADGLPDRLLPDPAGRVGRTTTCSSLVAGHPRRTSRRPPRCRPPTRCSAAGAPTTRSTGAQDAARTFLAARERVDAGDRMIAVDAVVVTAMADEAAAVPRRAPTSSATRPQMGHAEHRAAHRSAGAQVLLVQCGIGLVNSATAAAVAIQGTHPRARHQRGQRGRASAPDVRVGDVVVGSEYLYSGADARAFGYELGQVPGMPEVYEAEQVAARRRRDGDGRPARPVRHDPVRRRVHRRQPRRRASARRSRRPWPPTWSPPRSRTPRTCTGCRSCRSAASRTCAGRSRATDFLTHVDDAADRSAAVVIEVLRRLAVGDMAHAR